MKRALLFFSLGSLFLLLMANGPQSAPKWPKPFFRIPDERKDAAKIELGRTLFYDPILSIDSSQSCTSCHLSFSAFAHTDHALSHGLNDRIGTRNAPALFNLAWFSALMWDGSIHHPDVQALAPLENPDEMGEKLPHVLDKIKRSGRYQTQIQAAWGIDTLDGYRFLKSLSAFVLSLQSRNSRYDQWKAGKTAFNPQERQGYSLFQKACASCHPEPLFTTGKFERNGLPEDPELKDRGLQKTTQLESDSFKFKIPSLRNLVWSFPYMHDGRFKTLSQVLRFYSENQQTQQSNPDHFSAVKVPLLPKDQVDLLAFLKTLTDTSFVFNKKTGPPTLKQF